MYLLRNNTRRGCDCACRNITMSQLVKTSSDHLKCLLKEDIIKLCQFHDISFEPWKPKGFLIKCLEKEIYYPSKNVDVQNLCDHNVYLCYRPFEDVDKFYFNEKRHKIESYDCGFFSFSGDSRKGREKLKIIISKDNPKTMDQQRHQQETEILVDPNRSTCRYEDITNILYEGILSEIDDTIVIKSDDESPWKTATLKLNFLMKELKRLGADKHETYSCILDLHQDIVIPYHDEIDKEIAGIPSKLTNVT